MALVRLLRDGRVTLPADVLEALRLAEGDYLKAEVADGAVRLRPVAVVKTMSSFGSPGTKRPGR